MIRRSHPSRRFLLAALLVPGLAAAGDREMLVSPVTGPLQLSAASPSGRSLYTLELTPQAGAAEERQLLSLHGRLVERGSPASGAYDLELAVHGDVSGQTPLTAPFKDRGVLVQEGAFTVQLDLRDLGLEDSPLYLEARLKRSDGKSAWKTLRPRVPLRLPAQTGGKGSGAPAPAPSGVGSHWGEFWSGSGLGLYLGSTDDTALYGSTENSNTWAHSLGAIDGEALASAGDAVGILGRSYAPDQIGVLGINWSTYGVSRGASGASVSNSGTGVYGNAMHLWPADPATGAGYGVHGRSTWGQGRGVFGEATATSGNSYGVYGTSLSPSGVGVFGHATATTGFTYGVRAQSDSTSGAGVNGWATASSGFNYGVTGQSSSTSGTGVNGLASAASGTTYGVNGQSASTSGIGVRGSASATTGNTRGVWGSSNSSNGIGVYGGSTAITGNTYGVYGLSQSSGGTGVFADNTSSGVALHARSVSGNPIVAYGASMADREFYVSNTGEVYADGTFHSGGADFAELLPASEGLEPGDVLAIGRDGKLTRSSLAYQTSVLGIYSTQPGFLGGSGDADAARGKVPLAVVGLVPVKASTENGPIHPGDLLVAASTPGHAMAAGAEPPRGSVLGKALAGLESGSGTIRMFVLPQ